MIRPEIQKILLLRFSSMGDLVLLSTLVEHLRHYFPNAKVTLATRHDLSAIYQHNPGIAKVVSVRREQGLNGLWNLWKELRQESWDVVYDAHGSIRSILLRTLIPARYHLKIHKRTLQRLALIVLKKNWLPFVYFKDQLALPLGKLVGHPPPSIPTRIYLSDSEKKKVDHLWRFSPEDSVVGIVPSAQWTGKRWPIAKFMSLCERLIQVGRKIVVFGGPDDKFCALLEGPSVLNLQGKLNLLESFEGLSRCQMVIANDTGLMHAAEAVGTPVLALLGPTGEQFGFIPFLSKSRFETHRLWCRPCSKNGQGFCIRWGRRLCLTELPVDQVFQSTQRLLESR